MDHSEIPFAVGDDDTSDNHRLCAFVRLRLENICTSRSSVDEEHGFVPPARF